MYEWAKVKLLILKTKLFSVLFYIFIKNLEYLCRSMKRKNIILGFVAGLFLVGCTAMGGKLVNYTPNYKLGKINKVIYFQPSIFPAIEEIQSPTSQAFFGAVSDQMSSYNTNIKIIQMDHALDYENLDEEYLKAVGQNNEAEAIVIPHIKYFKVGFGKYVFSNQVVVSLKLYDNQGKFIIESQYDTYKGRGRLTGKAENSIKIGTKEVIKKLAMDLKKKKMY